MKRIIVNFTSKRDLELYEEIISYAKEEKISKSRAIIRFIQILSTHEVSYS